MVFQTHYRPLSKDALKYVRTLCLTTDVLPYHPWLGHIALEMTNLEEVFFELCVDAYIADVEYVIDVLARHNNYPRIQATILTGMLSLEQTLDALKAFELDWA